MKEHESIEVINRKLYDATTARQSRFNAISRKFLHLMRRRENSAETHMKSGHRRPNTVGLHPVTLVTKVIDLSTGIEMNCGVFIV
jgi:hypothetical protein